jgi:hypothetical protein
MEKFGRLVWASTYPYTIPLLYFVVGLIAGFANNPD